MVMMTANTIAEAKAVMALAAMVLAMVLAGIITEQALGREAHIVLVLVFAVMAR